MGSRYRVLLIGSIFAFLVIPPSAGPAVNKKPCCKPQHNKPGDGCIQVITEPVTMVNINGMDVGKTPLKTCGVYSMKHLVTLRNETLGIAGVEYEVIVKKDQTTRIWKHLWGEAGAFDEGVPTGHLTITTDADLAMELMIDMRSVGYEPPARMELRAGKYLIQLRGMEEDDVRCEIKECGARYDPAFHDWFFVTIEAGKETRVHRPAGAGAALSPPAQGVGPE
jgi:hypothetical protein